MRREPQLPTLGHARAYVRQNLVACATELLRRKQDGSSQLGATMHEAARLVTEDVPGSVDPIGMAELLVESLSLELAVELGAWRAHFPMHTFRRDAGCVSLRCRELSLLAEPAAAS